MREGKIIFLREFQLGDEGTLLRKFHDPEIFSKMDLELNGKEPTIDKEREWVIKTMNEYKQKTPDNLNLAIIVGLHDNIRRIEELVGGVGAHKINYEKSEAEICYWVGKNHQGQGYATCAIKMFCNELFKRVSKVRAEVFDNNIASQKVLENAGFCKVEKRPNEKTGGYDFFYERNNPLLNSKFLFRKMEVGLFR
ncbi:Acetyltransferase (GNAT) domain protein [uncultured archaeon]|nr:Acetyltransferase (GNAT) domain protein [uncultured archaeon]